jgi:iron complex outermembrane recepter protein
MSYRIGIPLRVLACGLGLGLVAPGARADEAPTRLGSDKESVEEIVVTARKKEEKLQETPVSVTAMTSEKLDAAQVTDLSQVQDNAPNLTFDTSAPLTGTSSAASIYMRGIGSSEFALSADPGVGIYVDGVYLARSIGAVIDMVDTERVEVLRGPQGTLFGRNTIGGAVNVISRAPEGEFGGQARVTVGTDRLIRTQGTVNIPISETLLSRVSFLNSKRDGFVENRAGTFGDTGDEDRWSARGALQWAMSDAVSLTLRADATRERQLPAPNVLVAFSENIGPGPNCQVVPVPPPGGMGMPALTFPNCSFVGMNNALARFIGMMPGAPQFPQFGEQFLNGEHATSGGFVTSTAAVNNAASKPLGPDSDLDVWGTSATLEWDLTPDVRMRSITAYRRLDHFFALDLDHSPFNILDTVNDYDQDQTTQEIQLFGTAFDKRVDWTVGAYYFDENGDHKDVVEFLGGPLTGGIAILSGGKFDNRATAAFGQVSFDITDQLVLTTGLRYSYEKKTFDVQRQQVIEDSTPVIPMRLPIGLPLILVENKATNRDRALSPHINLSYTWNDGLMTYASYSEGFKGGGFEQRVFPPRLQFVPKFDSEIARVFEVGAKSTMFDGRLILNGSAFFTRYKDLQLSVFDGIAPVTRNAAKARLSGVELETQFRPTPELNIEAGLGYIGTRYREIDSLATGVGKNNDFVNTPRWTAGASVAYTVEMGDRLGALTPRVGWTYRSDTSNDAFNTPALEEDQQNLYDASLTWEDPSGKWRVTLAGKNLTDRTYIVSGATVPMAGVTEASFARGRTWALSVERNF